MQVASRSGDMRRVLEACTLALDALIEETSKRDLASDAAAGTRFHEFLPAAATAAAAAADRCMHVSISTSCMWAACCSRCLGQGSVQLGCKIRHPDTAWAMLVRRLSGRR